MQVKDMTGNEIDVNDIITTIIKPNGYKGRSELRTYLVTDLLTLTPKGNKKKAPSIQARKININHDTNKIELTELEAGYYSTDVIEILPAAIASKTICITDTLTEEMQVNIAAISLYS